MRALLVALVAVSACSSDPSPAPPVAASTAGRITKVLTIVEENHGAASARKGMPYLASLAEQYGEATDYRSLTHPSLPNYLAMTAGSTMGVSDDGDPSAHPVSGPSVFDLAVSHGHTAKVYAESMPAPCDPRSSGRYAARHNTWTYFPDSTACDQLDVSADELDADVAAGTLPHVGMLIPDLCHDAHDCPLASADGYLRDVLRTVLAGPDWAAGRLAVVITFDEVEENDTGTLLTVVVAPSLHGTKVAVPLSHLAWSRWMAELVGAPPLRDAAGAPSLGKAFDL